MPFWAKITVENMLYWIFCNFLVFVKKGVKFYSISILRPDLESSHQMMSTINRGELIWILSFFLRFIHKQGTFLRPFLCQSHDTYIGYVSTKNDQNYNIFSVCLKTQNSYQLTPWEGVSWYRYVLFWISPPKKVLNELLKFWCF